MPNLTVSSNIDTLLSAANYAAVRTLLNVADGATAGATWGTNLSGIPPVISGTTASFTTTLASKLDGIAAGANNYTLPVATTTAIGGVKRNTGSGFVNGIDAEGNLLYGTPSGAGDVVGPASSTDNAIPLFNGTTGELLKDSPLTFSGSNITSSESSLVIRCNGGTSGTFAIAVTGASLSSPDGTDIWSAENGELKGTTNSVTRISITDAGMQLGGSGARVTTILDEDDMASDSATAVPTQQSVKAYVDANIGGGGIVSDPTGITGADAITNIVSLTQAEFDAIVDPATNYPTTIFHITDAAAGTLDQFDNVTQAAGKTLAITENTSLDGGSHSGINTGDLPAASQAEMEAGTETALKAMSPLRVAQAIAALATGSSMHIDSVLVDGAWSGITMPGVSGYSQAFGDLVQLDPTSGRWEAVDVSVAAAAVGDARTLLGMVAVAATDGNACTILTHGNIRADANFPTLTVGAACYATTAGDITLTQPSTTDNVIRVVGHALDANTIYFAPSSVWITHI